MIKKMVEASSDILVLHDGSIKFDYIFVFDHDEREKKRETDGTFLLYAVHRWYFILFQPSCENMYFM